MLFLDALIRVSAITMLLWLAVAAIKDIRPARNWPYLLLASLSTSALFFSLASPELALPSRLSLLSGFANVPHLVFVWLFALSVFQTNFKLSLWHLVLGLIYTFPIFWFRAYQWGIVPQPPFILTTGVSIGSALLMLHLVFIILGERRDDLIDERKRSRLVFVCVLVIVTVFAAIVDLYLIAAWPNHAKLIKAIAIWPSVFAGFLWIMRGSRDSFVIEKQKRSFSTAQNFIEAKDKNLFHALQKLIQDDHIYLDPNLTITKLAKDLAVSPHRLRALINQSLAYENFNQFVNGLRIESIIGKFDDPKNDHIPILTLALDGGFQSLSPFNMAFKRFVGQTPSQYRKSGERNREPIKLASHKTAKDRKLSHSG